jgi:hypothetical protein
MLRNRNPKDPRQDDVPIKRSVTSFNGMLTGEPASKISNAYSTLNRNIEDFGDYYKVRRGSRKYTSWRYGLPIINVDVSTNTITVDGSHGWETGDVVYFYGDDLPAPIAALTAYYVIYSGTNKIQLATTYANAIVPTRINITAEGTGYAYWGEINAREDHDSKNAFVVMMGQSVYVFNKAMTTIKKVLNQHGTNPDGISWMQKFGDDIFLFSATGGIFKIILEDEPRMHPVNLPVPIVLLDEVVETVSKIYGYIGIYSFSILGGTGNRSRFDSEIKFESGTCLVSGQYKDYGEYYFTDQIGVDLSVTHSVGVFTLPDTVLCATHFTYYRSRNIGENSGGVSSSINGVGNRRDFLVYDADIPVAKAFLLSGSRNIYSISSGNKFVFGDIGCTIKDMYGGFSIASSFVTEDAVTVVGTIPQVGGVACAIGGGRVMKVSQVDNVITINDGVDTFVAWDVGVILFVSDGTYRYVKKYISSISVEVQDSEDFSELAVTLKPLTGNFSRSWNDTVPDDPNASATYSLEDMYLYGNNPMYVPRRQFKPLPNSNCGMVGNGFMVVAPRDGMRYYYSQIGDKDYSAGYYRDPTQVKKVSGTVRHIINFQSMAVIMMRRSTGALILSSSSNVGVTDIGEVVSELPEMTVIDPERGVNLWQTIVFKNKSLIYAVTDDGAYRNFNGTAWSEDNYAYIGGKDAVSRFYLAKLDQSSRLVALYSPYGGMKLWITRNMPNPMATDTIYKVIQSVESGEEEKVIQSVESGEEDTIIQSIGVLHG